MGRDPLAGAAVLLSDGRVAVAGGGAGIGDHQHRLRSQYTGLVVPLADLP